MMRDADALAGHLSDGEVARVNAIVATVLRECAGLSPEAMALVATQAAAVTVGVVMARGSHPRINLDAQRLDGITAVHFREAKGRAYLHGLAEEVGAADCLRRISGAES